MTQWMKRLQDVLSADGLQVEWDAAQEAVTPPFEEFVLAPLFEEGSRWQFSIGAGRTPIAVVAGLDSNGCIEVARFAVAPAAAWEGTHTQLLKSIRLAVAGTGNTSLRLQPSPRLDVHPSDIGFLVDAEGGWVWRSTATAGDTFHAIDTPTLGTLADGVELPTAPSSLAPPVDPPTADLDVEDTIAGGRYQLQHYLGCGAMGDVWEAHDHRLGSTVALKILRLQHFARASLLARFLQEVRVTAQLDHPGIVSVLDTGRLEDGRPWFTMDLVRGEDLQQTQLSQRPLVDKDEDPSAVEAWVRRMTSVFLTVSQALASAHVRGVVHRDVKPNNIMLGRFGEVLLMDWGVARLEGEVDAHTTESGNSANNLRTSIPTSTRVGQRVGTPAYMAPEQLRGETSRISARADVFALGMSLYEVLTGALAPRDGDVVAYAFAHHQLGAVGVPGVLTELILHCLHTDPEIRPSAADVALRLQAYLDGSIRRARAEELFLEAVAEIPGLRGRWQQADLLEAEAQAILRQLPRWGPVAERQPAWRLQARAVAMRREALVAETDLEQRLRSVLELWDGHRAARRALVDLYMERIRSAEGRGEHLLAEASALSLARLSDPRATEFLLGNGRVTLVTEPAGARVVAYPLEEVDHRLTCGAPVEMGQTPLDGAVLPRGAWCLEISAPGYETIRYPIHLGRGEHWDGVPPGGTAPFPIRLPRVGELPEDVVVVPAGWTVVGGDPQSSDALPRIRVWVPGMVVQRYLVVLDDYFDFLDTLHNADEDPTPYVPRTDPPESRLLQRVDGIINFGHSNNVHFSELSGQCPVFGVTQAGARAYAAWLTQQTGISWQLPVEAMWEKAARGVDGRWFPWGNTFEGQWCDSAETDEKPMLRTVHANEFDESVYGVRGTAGLVRELCGDIFVKFGKLVDGEMVSTKVSPIDSAVELFCVRGGSFVSREDRCRVSARYAAHASAAYSSVGFRLFAVWE